MQNISKVGERAVYYTVLMHKIGALGVLSDGENIISILWEHEIDHCLKQLSSLTKSLTKKWTSEFALLDEQLSDYFNGASKEIRVNNVLIGSCFQKKVWRALLCIPYGTTCSYATFAHHYFSVSYMRVVSANLGRNPLPLIYPCHRVIRQTGQVGEFSGSTRTKEALLTLEQRKYTYQS